MEHFNPSHHPLHRHKKRQLLEIPIYKGLGNRESTWNIWNIQACLHGYTRICFCELECNMYTHTLTYNDSKNPKELLEIVFEIFFLYISTIWYFIKLIALNHWQYWTVKLQKQWSIKETDFHPLLYYVSGFISILYILCFQNIYW